MYYLSQICCVCLRNNVKLKHLHDLRYFDELIVDIMKIFVEDMIIFKLKRDFLICTDCVKCVEDMYAFRQTCIRNNRVLVEYVQQSCSFEGGFGGFQGGMNDETHKEYKDFLSENEIKVETEESDDKDPLETDEYVSKRNEFVEIKNDPQEIEHPLAEMGEVKIEIHENFTEPDQISYEENDLVPSVDAKKKYECDTCGKIFYHRSHLKSHNVLHTGEKPHKCETCGKCFSHKNSFNRHQLVHTGEKPYKCDTCNMSFAQIGSLKKHILTHTGEKPHRCEICGKCFSQLGTLITHNLTHTGEKPHKCEVCGKCFAQKCHLNQHSVIHTGEKPFKCEICNVSFTLNNILKKHLLIHAGKKEFDCDLCGKSFLRKNDVVRHKKTHVKQETVVNLCIDSVNK